MSGLLDCLFRPRGVAVVGASRSPSSVGGSLFHNLISNEFSGPVYPINREADSVQSVRAYRSIEDLPGPVDLAIIALPAKAVVEAARECAEQGAKALVVLSSGFAEIGPEGAAAQVALVDVAKRYAIRLVGPNCLGVVNTDPAIRLAATFGHPRVQPGNVSFCSQSGALGLTLLDEARELGIGVRQFASIGNRADVSTNDLLEYWGADPGTEAILLYVESFGNPDKFLEVARRVSKRKPIVAVKSGRSPAGARAALSHTGALAAGDAGMDALLRQAGVIRVDTLEELFHMGQLVASQAIPRGNRVAILTNAGGPAIMTTDACVARGLELATLSDVATRALRDGLSPHASVANPVDMIAGATADEYERSLGVLVAEPNVDALIALMTPTGLVDPTAVAEAIVRSEKYAEKPVLACLTGTDDVREGRAILRAAHVPTYEFPESASVALAGAARLGRWRRSRAGMADPEIHPRLRSSAWTSMSWLSRDAVKDLFQKHGIESPASGLAAGVNEAVAYAESLHGPVALKIVSKTITHKTDVGGVRVGLRDAAEVRRAFGEMMLGLERAGHKAEIEGVEVQAMAPRGVELLAGVTIDPAVGALIGFGIGGIHVELCRDVVFRVHPIARADAEEMLDQIHAAEILRGYRGASPVDRRAIVDVLMALDRIIEDVPELVELDINPLIAHPTGALAVDGRVRVFTPAT